MVRNTQLIDKYILFVAKITNVVINSGGYFLLYQEQSRQQGQRSLHQRRMPFLLVIARQCASLSRK